ACMAPAVNLNDSSSPDGPLSSTFLAEAMLVEVLLNLPLLFNASLPLFSFDLNAASAFAAEELLRRGQTNIMPYLLFIFTSTSDLHQL
ncbi:hypothetical protein OS493_006916, partial [Desmophyllum pertusum]